MDMAEINFEEYLSEEERKEIVASVFREKCVETLKNDGERVLSNASYTIVVKMVDEIFDNKMHELLAQKTKSIIDGLTSYTVFKRKDHWDKDESVGWRLLNEVMAESKPLLKNRISEIIATLNEDDIREYLKGEAAYLLDSKLFGKAA
jgi:tRNA 2-selenouridine synthase SelU